MLALTLFTLVPARAGIGDVNPSGVTHTPVTTNVNAFCVVGFVLTNFPVGAQKVLPLPKNGRFGFWASVGATNSLTVTNGSIATFEGLMYSPDGKTNVVDNWTIGVHLPVTGVTNASDIVTNFPTTLTDNRTYIVDALRLKSITNVNAESIFVTNFYLLTPPQ